MGQPWAHTGSPETPGQRVFQLFQDRANPFLGQGWICFAGLQGWGDASLAHGLSMPTPHRPCCHPEGMPLSPGLGDAQVKHGSSCWGGKWLSPGCSRANENSSGSPCSSSQPGTRCPALPDCGGERVPPGLGGRTARLSGKAEALDRWEAAFSLITPCGNQ